MTTVNSVTTGSAASASGSKAKNIVNKDDFFKLLVAQLKNQDPLKPVDATNFTAQLAQFSSLEKLENINSSMTSLLGQQDLYNRLGATQLAGKHVVASGTQSNSFTAAGRAVELGYQLPADAKQVFVTIYDEQGRAVDMIEKTDQSAGYYNAVWDNKTAKTGKFTFVVAAFDQQGKSIGATSLIQGVVSNVNFHDGQVYVTVNNQEVGIDQLLSVTGSTS